MTSENRPSPLHDPPALTVEDGGDTLHLHLSGNWRQAEKIPGLEPLTSHLAASDSGVTTVVVDAEGVSAWGSGLPATLLEVEAVVVGHGVTLRHGQLPQGVGQLLALARAPSSSGVPGGS
ncbi:MAG: hypothetical protein HQL50_14390, partial [Magnetococcales bacterium]|nr:hypothetical protein [Magnetococcales bacterium]